MEFSNRSTGSTGVGGSCRWSQPVDTPTVGVYSEAPGEGLLWRFRGCDLHHPSYNWRELLSYSGLQSP